MRLGAHLVDAPSFTLTSLLSKTKTQKLHAEDSNSQIVNVEDSNAHIVNSKDSTLSLNLISVHGEQGTRQGSYKSRRFGHYLSAITVSSPPSSTSLQSPVPNERAPWTVTSSNCVQATTFSGKTISLKRRKRSAKPVVR